MGQLNANLENVGLQKEFKIRTPGWYNACIIDSDVYYKDGQNHPTCKLEFEIEDGEPGHVWEYLSFASTPTKNGRTVAEISNEKLKTVATHGGHPNPNYIADSEELHGLRMRVKLKIEKDKTGQYEDKNRIVRFEPLDTVNDFVVVTATATPQNPTPTPPQNPDNTDSTSPQKPHQAVAPVEAPPPINASANTNQGLQMPWEE
jgi:hypothetical protein